MTTTKPQLSALKTPLSASFPSEMRSPCVGTPTFIKQEENQKTPITPPAAYLDFLSKLSPTLLSPLSASNTRFSFNEKPTLSSQSSTESIVTTASSASFTSTAQADSSKPSSPRSKSSRSSSLSSASSETTRRKRPEPISAPTGRVIPPPSPFTRPVSARTPRRLHIPQSPYSPGNARSPLSASSLYSPYSAAWSPRDSTDADKSRTTHMSVRQVVTRTITHYSRTPIVEPVPPSKKRKVEATDESS
ncbi:uncharacterized protein PV09_05514 [Verruconis gallopava]|uniref:Uncharacterized protein n=1 Tax=Verruconis gallopava TaxID=253628 RepID=A0A0D2A962_9PEZI|nr:uncharacterized protein PV09_05514 [Verruconis gallopava]KIW03303.1 hypothetical protein PV09_05514 [Verruconis gallopava]